MTDHHEPGERDADIDRIEALLREMTQEDGQLLELPSDLWAGIEADLDDDHANVVALDRRRRFSPRMAISAAAAAVIIIAASPL